MHALPGCFVERVWRRARGAQLHGLYGDGGLVSGQGERTARLTLKDDGVAAVQLSSPGRPSEFFAEGTWRRTDDGFVIELPGAADRLAFRRSGNLIIAKEWDPARWGNEAPVLYLVY